MDETLIFVFPENLTHFLLSFTCNSSCMKSALLACTCSKKRMYTWTSPYCHAFAGHHAYWTVVYSHDLVIHHARLDSGLLSCTVFSFIMHV